MNRQQTRYGPDREVEEPGAARSSARTVLPVLPPGGDRPSGHLCHASVMTESSTRPVNMAGPDSTGRDDRRVSDHSTCPMSGGVRRRKRSSGYAPGSVLQRVISEPRLNA